MIVGELKNWRRYAALAELKPAFEFLERHGGDLKEGRNEIDGARMYANCETYSPKPAETSEFESHRRYADVQFVGAGAEMIGHAPTETLPVTTPYSEEEDIAYYSPPGRFTRIAVPAGTFVVLYPEDGHMPGCLLDSTDQVAKIVVKVRLA